MIPRTLSASSLQVWTLCPDRWNAEYLNRAPSFSNSAADVGTAFHGGAELFVKALFVDKTHDPAKMSRKEQKELLVTFFQMSYIQTFNSADLETAEYKDGFALTMRWFERTDLTTKPMLGVESTELKETILVPYNHPDGTVHELSFNYIMDRVDQIEDTVWEVVDYKTIRVPLQPEDLEDKIQARAYALAIQIKHPEATKVIVTFDQIRHEPISLEFSRDDNIAFWRFLTEETQRIIDTPESDARPRLNPECGFCVKKFTCPLMQRNIAAGGIHSLSIDESIDLVAKLKAQIKANERIVSDLEDIVFRHAAESDTLQWETGDGAHEVEVGVGRRRQFPAHKAAEIMGPELFAQMGSMTLGNLEKIIKDESLPKDMRDQLSSLIAWTNGNLQLKVKPKKKLI
jgi:hypothetical protein